MSPVCVMRREVAKAVRLRKACTVVVAPNIEHIEAEGGLDDLLTSILTQAEASDIPIIFALSWKKLGQVSCASAPTLHGSLEGLLHDMPGWVLLLAGRPRGVADLQSSERSKMQRALLQMFGCRKKMSAIAILDYSGAEAVYHHMESLAQEGRQSWVTHHGSSSPSTGSGPSSQPQSAMVTVPQHAGSLHVMPCRKCQLLCGLCFVCRAENMAASLLVWYLLPCSCSGDGTACGASHWRIA